MKRVFFGEFAAAFAEHHDELEFGSKPSFGQEWTF
jgi:hypothetical protein